MITVFTPAYNRASTLERLYKSLQAQSRTDFEWLIIDDGSTDGTETAARKWLAEKNAFTIRYIKTKNGGKHRAINAGVKETRGEAFFIVDSDDCLPPRAVERTAEVFASVAKDVRFAGICGLKADIGTKKALYNSAKAAGKDCSMFDIRYKYHIKGDMAEVFKTEVLKEYPFPCFEGEKFLNEAVVWNKIAEKYIMRYIGDILYYCEYLPGGLTSSIRRQYRNSPQGAKLFYGGLIKDKKLPLKERIKACILYWRYLCFNKQAFSSAGLSLILFWPVGTALYFYDFFRGAR